VGPDQGCKPGRPRCRPPRPEPQDICGTFEALQHRCIQMTGGVRTELRASQDGEHRDSMSIYRTVWRMAPSLAREQGPRRLRRRRHAGARDRHLDGRHRCRLAEEALRASEERFRRQYKGFPLPTCSGSVGDEFVLQDFNDASEAIAGVHSDLVGQPAATVTRTSPSPAGSSGLRGRAANYPTQCPYRYRATASDRDLAVTCVFVPRRR
jgi:hypothetical protein